MLSVDFFGHGVFCNIIVLCNIISCIVEPTHMSCFLVSLPGTVSKSILGQDARTRWLYLLLCMNKDGAINCAGLHVLVYIVNYTGSVCNL